VGVEGGVVIYGGAVRKAAFIEGYFRSVWAGEKKFSTSGE